MSTVLRRAFPATHRTHPAGSMTTLFRRNFVTLRRTNFSRWLFNVDEITCRVQLAVAVSDPGHSLHRTGPKIPEPWKVA